MKNVTKKPDSSIENEIEIYKQIGERIKQLRKDAGFTNYENFAFEHDLNRVHYGRMERGINFTMKSLLKVLAVHRITMKEFFNGID